MPLRSPPTILALAPGTRHLGFAVLQGAELVRFGVKTFPGRKTPSTLWSLVRPFLSHLLRLYPPNILVLEDAFYAQARLSPLLTNLITQLKHWARQHNLRSRTYLPTVVKQRLCHDKQTRRTLAQAMVNRYWFLYSYLKAGTMPHYWYQMFDAVALATIALADIHSTTSQSFPHSTRNPSNPKTLLNVHPKLSQQRRS